MIHTQTHISISDLANEITLLAGHLNAAHYRWLKLIAEFDRRQGWSDWATQSCAHWLNWKCCIDMGAAREKVRVAHALESLPKIAAAMERGELSYSKARALTRVATEATEEDLLITARHGTAQHVENLVRHFRRALDVEELGREARQRQNRSVTYSYDDDGSLILKARLPTEIGAMVLKALDTAMEQMPESADDLAVVAVDVSAETPTVKLPRAALRADALGATFESMCRPA